MTTDHDHASLLQAIDSGDRTALYLLADWYEDHESDIGAGLRWILRTGRSPSDTVNAWWNLDTVAKRQWKIRVTDLPKAVFNKLNQYGGNGSPDVYYPTPSAAYLDAAAAACKALRSCCSQLWGEGEACAECGSKYRVADFYEPAEIEIDHDVRDLIRDWAND